MRGTEYYQQYIVNKLQNCLMQLLLGKHLGISITYAFILTFPLYPDNIACYKMENSSVG